MMQEAGGRTLMSRFVRTDGWYGLPERPERHDAKWRHHQGHQPIARWYCHWSVWSCRIAHCPRFWWSHGLFLGLAGRSSTELCGSEAASEAISWWRSPEARSYFEQNPDQLQTVAQNPVLFVVKWRNGHPDKRRNSNKDQRQQTLSGTRMRDNSLLLRRPFRLRSRLSYPLDHRTASVPLVKGPCPLTKVCSDG